MNKIIISIFLSLLLGSTSFASGFENQDKIIEGKSIPGGFYLGMSKSEVLSAGEYDNCETRNPCLTQSIYDGSIIFITFEGNEVSKITVQNKVYKTTRGASSSMTPLEIAALYDGSIITKGKEEGEYKVSANKYGYAFSLIRVCSQICSHARAHTIFYPSNVE